KSSGVGTDKVAVEPDLRTGITLSLTYPEDKAQVTYAGSVDSLVASDVRPELFHGYGHLHVSSIYLQRKLLGSFREILAAAKRAGLTTSLDTQADPRNRYEHVDEMLDHVDILLTNDAEAKGITKSQDTSTALERLSLKVPAVVVKCGNKGAIGRADKQVVRVDALKIDPVDTTGAGDSFDAGFIYFYLHKRRSFEESIRFANALGALSCLYVGGAEEEISEEDVLGFMKNRSHLPK
ncbi:MAG: PfkB family carbohydrate kinase, partial [Nitrososphaerota archaeon]